MVHVLWFTYSLLVIGKIKSHLTHSYMLRKDPPPQCILTVCHIFVEYNHFARERKDIFGRRDEGESFRFHSTLIVLFLKQIEFYYKL